MQYGDNKGKTKVANLTSLSTIRALFLFLFLQAVTFVNASLKILLFAVYLLPLNNEYTVYPFHTH